MVNAQEWLDKECPKEKRNEVTELEINKRKEGARWLFTVVFSFFSKRDKEKLSLDENLEGDLDLSDFVNLKNLNCSNGSGQITSLNIKNLTKLEELNCSGNQIKKLDLSDNTSLKTLFCHKNPLEEITGLERLRKLTFLNSTPFNFLTNELGKNIDDAKKTLDEYKALLSNECETYQRAIDTEINSEKVFNENESSHYRKEIDVYREQMAKIEVLTNKWK